MIFFSSRAHRYTFGEHSAALLLHQEILGSVHTLLGHVIKCSEDSLTIPRPSLPREHLFIYWSFWTPVKAFRTPGVWQWTRASNGRDGKYPRSFAATAHDNTRSTSSGMREEETANVFFSFSFCFVCLRIAELVFSQTTRVAFCSVMRDIFIYFISFALCSIYSK